MQKVKDLPSFIYSLLDILAYHLCFGWSTLHHYPNKLYYTSHSLLYIPTSLPPKISCLDLVTLWQVKKPLQLCLDGDRCVRT